MMLAYGNEPVTDPDIDGAGRAWRIDPDLGEENAGIDASWLVHAPHGHPIWNWYVVSAIHLRPLPIKGPAHRVVPHATHEIVIVALNPDRPLPDVEEWDHPAYLEPPELLHQFVVHSDEQAQALVQMVVQNICEGNSPDEDYRAYWQRVVDDTAQHFCYGCHPDLN